MAGEVKILARDWDLTVSDGAATPEFVAIGGITGFTFGASKTDADITTFDSEGSNEHLVASRSRTLSVEGKYMETTLGVSDVGQARIEVLAAAIGAASIADFKLKSPGGAIRTFKGSVKLGDIGGENDDATSWGFEITVSGPVTRT